MLNLRPVNCCARCRHSFKFSNEYEHTEWACVHEETKLSAPEVQPFHLCDLFEPEQESNG